MCLGFQVADVKKPLISVRRIGEKGNHVSFGPKEEDNYIINKETGDKMMLKPNGKGSYLMQVRFAGGEATEITVDSGAEENVSLGLGIPIRNKGGGEVDERSQCKWRTH